MMEDIAFYETKDKTLGRYKVEATASRRKNRWYVVSVYSDFGYLLADAYIRAPNEAAEQMLLDLVRVRLAC